MSNGRRTQGTAGRTTSKMPAVHVPLRASQTQALSVANAAPQPPRLEGGHVEAELSRVSLRRTGQPMTEIFNAATAEDGQKRAIVMARQNLNPLAVELTIHIFPRKRVSGAELPPSTAIARLSIPHPQYKVEARVFREAWRVDVWHTLLGPDGVS